MFARAHSFDVQIIIVFFILNLAFYRSTVVRLEHLMLKLEFRMSRGHREMITSRAVEKFGFHYTVLQDYI